MLHMEQELLAGCTGIAINTETRDKHRRFCREVPAQERIAEIVAVPANSKFPKQNKQSI